MIIYFRACEKQNTISYVNRINNIDKSIILKKCWLSIQKSITKNDRIVLIEDSVSDDTIDWMINTSTVEVEIIKVPEHSWEYHQHTVTLVETLKQYINKFPSELHYIVEDDYLHTENALAVLSHTLNIWEGFAVPYDYPDRYSNPKPTQVYIGLDRHWRTVDSSTMTVLAKGSTWKLVIEALEEAAPTSNDKIFETIYTKIPCISPLPGVATHLTENHNTPLVDWTTVWNSIHV